MTFKQNPGSGKEVHHKNTWGEKAFQDDVTGTLASLENNKEAS